MRKRYVIIGITCALLLIAGICYSCTYKNDNIDSELITNLSGDDYSTKETEDNVLSTVTGSEISIPETGYIEEAATSHTIIYVHLCGEVIQPGVYQVNQGSRVIDLIELAGGLTKKAAGDYVNQAQQVADGQRIYIPSEEEVKELPFNDELPFGEVVQSEQSLKKLININLAGKEELMNLPGVGEAKAASIIEYRSANGHFQTIEELMKIPGIKEGLFNKVSSYITVK